MRVCLFGNARSPHLQQIVPGLVERGLSVHVVTHRPAPIRGATVEKFKIPPPSLMNPRRWRGRYDHYLRSFLEHFDIVHVHFLSDWGFGPDMLDQGCFVITAWGSDIVSPPGSPPPAAELVQLRKELLRRADGVTVCSARFARTVADFAGVDADRIEIVPFGVNLRLFDPGLVRRTLPDRAPRIGFYKGFRPVYGLTYFIEAMPMILRQCPTVGFDLIGEGEELASLPRTVRRPGRGPCH